jgi:uncharacterized membrane protein YGL010W
MTYLGNIACKYSGKKVQIGNNLSSAFFGSARLFYGDSPMDRLAEERVKYEQRHTTTGCKITHMIGVPLIVLSVPMLLFSRKKALAMFGIGWTLQFSGHMLFEKNSPVFVEDPFNPYTYLTAVLFMRDEWVRVLSGQRPVNAANPDDVELDDDAVDTELRRKSA